MSADTRKYDLYVGGVRVDVYPVGLREHLPALTRFATVQHPAMRGHRWEALRSTGRRLLHGTIDWLTGRNPTWLHGHHAEPASFVGPFEFTTRCGIGWTQRRATADLLAHARGDRP